jgi:hypothetical protein
MLSAVSTSILILMLIGFATRNLVQVSRIAPRVRRYRVGYRVGDSEARRDRARNGFQRR